MDQILSEYYIYNCKNILSYNFFYKINRSLPPSEKKARLSLEDVAPMSTPAIPHILQGEIARLDQKFKVSLDPAAQMGTKTIKLVCCLDDKYLPCVPPVSVSIPGNFFSIN